MAPRLSDDARPTALVVCKSRELRHHGKAVARPGARCCTQGAHDGTAGEIPPGPRFYVFWLSTDENRFSSSGELLADAELPLHYSQERVIPGVVAACADLGIDVVFDQRARTLSARDAGRQSVRGD
jgi:hypothetical protein